MSGAKRLYEITNDGRWMSVGYDCGNHHRHVSWVSVSDVTPSIASGISEALCAALNAVEAAKRSHNSRKAACPKRSRKV